MGQFDDMIPEFVTESRDLLPEVETGLLNLETDPDSVDPETVNTIFRAMHSIKGGASFVGLSNLEHLAHKMEDVLNLVRNGDLTPGNAVVAELLTSLDSVTEMLDNVETSNDYPIDDRVAALQALIEGEAGPEVVQAMATPAVSTSDHLADFSIDEYTVTEKFKRGQLYVLKYDLLQAEQDGVTPIKLIKDLTSLGEVVDAAVKVEAVEADPLEPAALTLGVVFFSVMEEELLTIGLHPAPEMIVPLTQEDFQSAQAAAPAPETAAPVETAAPPEAPSSPPPAPEPAPSAAPPAPEEPIEEEPEAESTAGEYLTFLIGEEEYGLKTSRIKEIISMQHITRLPRSPSFVKGVINLRGMVVPVVCLREKLGFDSREPDKYSVIIVSQVEDKTIGLVVDSVSDVNDLTEQQIQSAPEFSRQVSARFVSGLGQVDERFVILLNVNTLLSKSELIPAE